MSKNLGRINIHDDKALLEIVEEETDIDASYFNTSATWEIAEKLMDETGQDATEVRIDGLNYVMVERSE